jgi:hypothetical protein
MVMLHLPWYMGYMAQLWLRLFLPCSPALNCRYVAVSLIGRLLR